MFTLKKFVFILLTITTREIYCQNVTAQFQIFAADTDLGSCTCDLTVNKCDPSCCCDLDCSTDDQDAFSCSSKDNIYTNSTPIVSSVQSSCYQNLSIFRTNSPYVIQKMGELVCIDYQRYSGSQYYQQPQNQTLNATNFIKTINTENSVTAPTTLPTNTDTYKVGASILTYSTARSAPIYYSLPIRLFNHQICSGSQTITYMNDFVSTCSQIVSQTTCSDTLNPLTHINNLCLIKSPARPFDNSTYSCYNTVGNTSNFVANVCENALKSLAIEIFYSNPSGIVNFTISYTTANITNAAIFEQTFTVRFVKSGSSVSTTTNNPGYRQGSDILVATVNGSTITSQTSSFTIVKPTSVGSCTTDAALRIPIRFGESIRSACKYSSTATSGCPNLDTVFMPITSSVLYVAAYNNPNWTNITTDWLPVKSCTSTIGIPNNYQCIDGIRKFSSSDTLCYIKLDIQIAYTNIGTLSNPQHVLSAVVFHFQGQTSSSDLSNTTFLVMESVTFQDISAATVIEEGQIPSPNTRLPADFFYPFSSNQATKSMTNSLFAFILISILFILM